MNGAYLALIVVNILWLSFIGKREADGAGSSGEG